MLFSNELTSQLKNESLEFILTGGAYLFLHTRNYSSTRSTLICSLHYGTIHYLARFNTFTQAYHKLSWLEYLFMRTENYFIKGISVCE